MATNNNVFSMTEHGRTEAFDLQVARGLVPYHSEVNIFGYQAAVGTNQYAVWENVADYVFPVSAQTMNLASDNNADTATILITGLDANYAQIQETLTLNGATAVTTANQYFRINSMQVTTKNPTGIITLKDTTDTTLYAQINSGFGKTQSTVYTVPAGYTFYLSRIDAYTSTNGSSADFISYRNYSISSTGIATATQQAPFTNTYHAQRVMPRSFTEKTDIQLQARTSANSYVVSIAAEGFLIANAIPLPIIQKQLQQQTDQGRWVIDVPGNGDKPCFMLDPQIIPQKWGGNLWTKSIDIQSSLGGVIGQVTKMKNSMMANMPSTPAPAPATARIN